MATTDQTMPTAAELRHEMREELARLRKVNAELLTALRDLVWLIEQGQPVTLADFEAAEATHPGCTKLAAARAAIAKATTT